MVSNNVLIRSFQVDDLLRCHEIIRSVYEDYGNIDDYAGKAIHSDMADIQANYLDIPGGHWWVAILDEQHLVGQIAIQPLAVGDERCYQDIFSKPQYLSHISPNQICELRRLAVLSKHQRQQVGSKLLRAMLGYARGVGYKAIHLTTLTSMKSACQFYDKHGFHRGKIELYNLHFNTNNQVKYTKSTVFENATMLTEDDRRLAELPMSESHQIYVQHYWMILSDKKSSSN